MINLAQEHSNEVIVKLPSHWNFMDSMLGTWILTNSLAEFELSVPDRHPQGFVLGNDESGQGNKK